VLQSSKATPALILLSRCTSLVMVHVVCLNCDVMYTSPRRSFLSPSTPPFSAPPSTPPLPLPLCSSLLQASTIAQLEQKCRESEARTSSAQREAESNREALSSLMACVQEQKALSASHEVWVKQKCPHEVVHSSTSVAVVVHTYVWCITVYMCTVEPL